MLINLFLNYTTQLGQSISIFLKDEKGQLLEPTMQRVDLSLVDLLERIQNAKEKDTVSYEYENTYCEMLKDFLASQKIIDKIAGVSSSPSTNMSMNASSGALAWA